MNYLSILTLKALRKLYAKAFGGNQLPPLRREENVDRASELIYNLLMQDKPCMIARFGAFELATVVNYLGTRCEHRSAWKFVKGEQGQWWWNRKLMAAMKNNAGFFPATAEGLSRFGEMMLRDAKEVDLLGSWLRQECFMEPYMPRGVVKVSRENSNPFFAQKPWTKALEGKKVLVVHPFAKSILAQYERRGQLFENPDMLPTFHSLQVIKAVQSLGGEANGFDDWFEALDYMKAEIDKRDYDICLIGCGAYGFPLAAHVKRQGKKAVHLGGVLQLYFGIKGKRWESQGYIGTDHDYSKLFNEHWVRPSADETPAQGGNVEGGCYW